MASSGGALFVVGISALSAWLAQQRRSRRKTDELRAKFATTLEERTRIARELHDTPLTGFGGIALQLEALRVTCGARGRLVMATGEPGAGTLVQLLIPAPAAAETSNRVSVSGG